MNYVITDGEFEVDFLVRGVNGGQTLIQVCTEPDKPAIFARKVRALQDVALIWPDAALQLITLTAPPAPTVPPNIKVHLALDWLLQG